MRKYFTFLAVVLFSFVCISATADEMPFGSFDFDWDVTAERLDTLHDTLGFNYFVVYDCIDCDEINNYWHSAGISVINSCGANDSSYIKVCTNYHYAVFEAEDRGEQIDFFNVGGSTTDSTWESDYSNDPDTLYGPTHCMKTSCAQRYQYIKFERKYIAESLYPYGNIIIPYRIAIRMMIDTLGSNNDLVAILENHYTNSKEECF